MHPFFALVGKWMKGFYRGRDTEAPPLTYCVWRLCVCTYWRPIHSDAQIICCCQPSPCTDVHRTYVSLTWDIMLFASSLPGIQMLYLVEITRRRHTARYIFVRNRSRGQLEVRAWSAPKSLVSESDSFLTQEGNHTASWGNFMNSVTDGSKQAMRI